MALTVAAYDTVDTASLACTASTCRRDFFIAIIHIGESI